MWAVRLNVAASVGRTLRPLLPPAELQAAERLHSKAAGSRFVVRRAVRRIILGAYLSLPPRALDFSLGDAGKPRLTGHTNGLQFNASHSGNLALIAVTRATPIGVDIERVRPTPADRIANRFFSPTERSTLMQVPRTQRLEAFFQYWTRKEAFLKATGDGLRRSLDSFDVVGPADVPRLLRTRSQHGADWSSTTLRLAPGYVAALVLARANLGIIRCWRWERNVLFPTPTCEAPSARR